jgi:hypothetical protein
VRTYAGLYQGVSFEKGVLFFLVFAFLGEVCLPTNIARIKNQENPRPKRFVRQSGLSVKYCVLRKGLQIASSNGFCGCQ